MCRLTYLKRPMEVKTALEKTVCYQKVICSGKVCMSFGVTCVISLSDMEQPSSMD